MGLDVESGFILIRHWYEVEEVKERVRKNVLSESPDRIWHTRMMTKS